MYIKCIIALKCIINNCAKLLKYVATSVLLKQLQNHINYFIPFYFLGIKFFHQGLQIRTTFILVNTICSHIEPS